MKKPMSGSVCDEKMDQLSHSRTGGHIYSWDLRISLKYDWIYDEVYKFMIANLRVFDCRDSFTMPWEAIHLHPKMITMCS